MNKPKLKRPLPPLIICDVPLKKKLVRVNLPLVIWDSTKKERGKS